MTEIETERLRLRLWQEQDFGPFADYYAHDDSARYVGGWKNLDEAWRHFVLQIGHWQLNGFGYWAVEEKQSGDFIGSVGLWQSAGWPEMELGYWLREQYRGKGYAREAAQQSKAHARSVLNAPSLVSYIHPDNTPSMKLAESLGAWYEQTIELLSHGPHCIYRHF